VKNRLVELGIRDEIADAVLNSGVAVSVSGGKDSAATALFLRELGIPCRYVFADTGWEHEDTYAYLRGELTRVLGPIDEVRSKHGGLADLSRKKKMFPSRLRRFCTEELKVFPIAKWVDEHENGVMAVGIRADESAKRAAMKDWEWSDAMKCWSWRPILSWTEADVIAIHRRHGLMPNPLYLRGASRVGCWPCIFARKAEIAGLDEARIEEIRALERDVGDAAELRGSPRPKFFQGRLRDPATKKYIGWDIDRVMDWSRTDQRTKLPIVVDEAERDDGCARWGLCEARTKGKP